MEIMQEIQRRVKNETRTPAEIFMSLTYMGMQMFRTRALSEEQVVAFCSGLIAIYNKRKKEIVHTNEGAGSDGA